MPPNGPAVGFSKRYATQVPGILIPSTRDGTLTSFHAVGPDRAASERHGVQS
jgi:hypothetical protein